MKTFALAIVVFMLLSLAFEIGWLRGFSVGWDAVECVDVSDPDSFVAAR